MHCLNKGWIQTYSGKKVFPLQITPEDVDLEDIAHALSHRIRFAGHSRDPVTVAQHSVMVALACPPEYQFAGLHHDSAEAYLGDIVAPLKAVLPPNLMDLVGTMEHEINHAIFRRFNISALDFEGQEAVRRADQRALVSEVKKYLRLVRSDFTLPDVPEIATHDRGLYGTPDRRCWHASDAKYLFMDAHKRLASGQYLVSYGEFCCDVR